jgi:hypothetical protein
MHFFLASAIATGGTLSLVSFDFEAMAMYGLVVLVIGLIGWSKLNEPPLSDPYRQKKPGDDPAGVSGPAVVPGGAKRVVDRKNGQHQILSRAVRELGPLIKRQAHEQWNVLHVANRRERGQHVWRFRFGTGEEERFLRISYRAMVRAEKRTSRLFEQLQAGRWLERLKNGPETALLLTSGGKLRAWPRQ